MKSELRQLARRVVRATISLIGRITQYRNYGRAPAEVFTNIYHGREWGDPDSVSGSGSNLRQTEKLREDLPRLFDRLRVRTMLDVPCGDFHWMSRMNLDLERYVGGDIVKRLVTENQRTYGNERRSFVELDLMRDPLPKADLLFCRDCLVHLSFEHALAALENVTRSEVTWILMTTFPEHDNRDIVTGSWRPLNLQKAPFLLPDPVELVSENCTESEGAADKSLGLWRVSDLRARFRGAGR